MNSVEYLEKELKKIYENIEGITVKYEYVKFANSHIVEVTPENIYNENKSYLVWEEKIEKNFYKKFPNEEVIFGTEDFLSDMMEPHFCLPSEPESNINNHNESENCIVREEKFEVTFKNSPDKEIIFKTDSKNGTSNYSSEKTTYALAA